MKQLAEWVIYGCWPPTLNTAYVNTDKGRSSTQALRDFKRDCKALVQIQGLPNADDLAKCEVFFLELHFIWSGWFKKDGQLKKHLDVSNRIKAIEDAICEAIGIDDGLIASPIALKRKPIHEKEDKAILARLAGSTMQDFVEAKAITVDLDNIYEEGKELFRA